MATDIYSLGCLLWAALTGAPPYRGSDVDMAVAHLRAPVPQLPGDDPVSRRANAILARAMAKRPEDRYASAREMREDLAALRVLATEEEILAATSPRHADAVVPLWRRSPASPASPLSPRSPRSRWAARRRPERRHDHHPAGQPGILGAHALARPGAVLERKGGGADGGLRDPRGEGGTPVGLPELPPGGVQAHVAPAVAREGAGLLLSVHDRQPPGGVPLQRVDLGHGCARDHRG